MMDLQAIEVKYVTAPEMARECGVTLQTVHSWLKYHRYMKSQYVFGKPVVERTEYSRFKRERPELIRTLEREGLR